MRYRDNTVKGTRRGSKWPEAVKTACMCDLLTDNNLSVVARRHGVPESTLRTWERQARRKTPGEQKSLFEAAREQELRELLAVYYEQDVSHEVYDSVDGERYVKEG